MKTQSFKEDFVRLTIEHGKLILSGDSKNANKVHKKLTMLYRDIKLKDDLGILSAFYDHPDESVKFWAATYTLHSNPTDAEALLRGLSKLTSIVGLSARTTLQLWKQGKLNEL